MRSQIIDLALDAPELSPREIAVRFTDTQAYFVFEARVRHKPRLLTDNGSSYIATELADGPDKRKIEHIRGASCHSQTQGND